MSDPKETLSVINRALPNFYTFITTILKREKLSEEAEANRARYEVILKAMEEGHAPPRPVSLIGDDDSGYHSKGGFLPEQIPSICHSGFLLKRDDKYRWHRYWCKADGKDMKFSIFTDSNEETLVKRLPLATVTSSFGPLQATECDKENCFILSETIDGGNEGANGSTEDLYLAAYSDVDYQHWHAALGLLIGTRESLRMSSATFLESTQWGALASGHDNTSTGSSNLSNSNRESMISTTSSLPYILRLPSQESPPRGRSPLGQGASAGDTGSLPSKQSQPLPSPPPEDAEDEDNASVGTIYENIDNLVMQFDSTMQATVQAMGQVGQQLKSSKKHKKKDRSLLRQASFFKGSKGQRSKMSPSQMSELEKGECFSGYLFKRSSSGSWKKRWCVLKGAVLSYSKNPEDSEGRKYVVLDAKMERIKDAKKSFAFTMQLKGVPEPLCFGTEDEIVLTEWIAKLENASNAKGDFNWDQWKAPGSDGQLSHYNSQTSLDSVEMSESHYNVPRGVLTSEQATSELSTDDAIMSGIYSIPRSLPVFVSSTFSVQGQPFSLSADPFAQYDVPRPVSLIHDDEEAIYDYPENITDMEIYDYPPDALSFLPPPPDTCPIPLDSNRNSVVTDLSPSTRSSLAVPVEWDHTTLAPPPVSLSSSRPSIAISTASSDEFFQSARNSVSSLEGLYDHPRSRTTDILISTNGGTVDEPIHSVPKNASESSIEFGMCAMKGYLYKKERFTWNKMHCLIRNSFLECRKPSNTQGPSLKLFLPRSIVTPDREVKRQWAFKVKHPRREGVLQFAAESEQDYRNWMKAFNSAAAIEVQSVNTVDEIRITDLDMQNRWTTLERNSSMLQPPDAHEIKKEVVTEPATLSVRRNTYSSGDEYVSDTLKRRRKFSWIKNLSKKRGMHHITASVGQLESETHRKENVNGGVAGLVPTKAAVPSIVVRQQDRACHITTEEGIEQFQGYLKVQRKGADNMWVRYWCVLEDLIISCYISKGDLTLTLSIQLKGSRVADALHDCKREFSFKIWHLESGQCLFFAADDGIEYSSWFKEVTKGAEYVVPLDAGISNSPMSAPFYHYAKDTQESSPSQRSSRSSIASLPDIDMDNVITNTSGGTIVHRGNLKKLSQNKWKDRYCLIKDSMLQIFATSTEKTLLSSIPLCGCRVELVNVPNEEVHQFTFRVSPSTGKAHMFSAPSEQEMYTWAITLQDACNQSSGSKENEDSTNKGNKRQKTKDLEQLVSHVPASELINPVYAGYAEVLLMSSWNRFWCVIHTGSLYLYQSQESQATIHTIVLKGYDITVGGPPGCKKPCVITMQYPGVCAILMALSDQNELTLWFNALERATKIESIMRQQQKVTETKRVKRDLHPAVAVSMLPHTGMKMKKAMKPKQSAESPLQKDTEDNGPTKASDVPQTIIRKYEKKIRKTHRVANLTEQNLKQQQTSLMHFKQELSRLTIKLQELANKGDQHAVKRLKNVNVKLQQIEKIIPYIGKYILVNRQAEIQTVAILKETCTVDMERFKRGGRSGGLPPLASPNVSREFLSSSTESLDHTLEHPAIHKLSTPLETHLEEVECTNIGDAEPPTPHIVTSESPLNFLHSGFEPNASVDVPRIQLQSCSNESNSSSLNILESEGVIPSSVALLDESHNQTLPTQQSCNSSYVNLSDIQAEVAEINGQMKVSANQAESHSEKAESPYATLVSVRPRETNAQEVQYAEVNKAISPTLHPKSPSSNYAELDFTKMARPTPSSPSSRLNYIQVDFDPSRSKMCLPFKERCFTSKPSDTDVSLVAMDKEMLDDTLTPENALTTPPTTHSQSHSAISPKSRISAMQDAVKLFEPSQSSTPVKTQCSPPPVKRKPKQQTFSPALSTPQPSSLMKDDVEAASPTLDTKPPLSDAGDAQSVTAGTMSVMERIKALQTQNI